MKETSKSNEKLDISPLVVIERVHRDRYGTVKLLKVLFNNFEKIFSNLGRNDQFLHRSYIQRLMIQVTCQYGEDVGSYSVACKKIGLLYPALVMSVMPDEIGRFYAQVDKLTDKEIQKIFNIRPGNRKASSINYTQIKEKYKKLKKFRSSYQSLYNAMKHGNRVFCHEMSKKNVSMDSLHGTSLTFTWIHINPGKTLREKVKAQDGSEIEISLKEWKTKNLILESDNVEERVNITEDCYQILENIINNYKKSK